MEAAKDEKVTPNDAEDTTATESLNTSGISSGAESVEDTADFSEEDAKKAEEYKTKGNDYFKGKCQWGLKSI